MKLASLKPDGALVVVSDDLAWYADAARIAPTLQAALDAWERLLPDLIVLAKDVRSQAIPLQRFHEHDAVAPLPAHAQDTLPAGARLGPRDTSPLAEPATGGWTVELVTVTGAVPQGASADEALAGVRLVGFAAGRGDGAWACSPVLVTPDALEPWWRDGKLHRTLMVDLNGRPWSRAAADMATAFGPLIARAAGAGALPAGTIVGSGAIGEKGGGGEPLTPNRGDTIRVWIEDDRHHPVFGAIEQAVGG